jgi:hypothetical protein
VWVQDVTLRKKERKTVAFYVMVSYKDFSGGIRECQENGKKIAEISLNEGQ